LPSAASLSETSEYIVARALRTQGFGQCRFNHLPQGCGQAAVCRVIDRLVRRTELMPVNLEGAGKMQHWARPETLEQRARPGDEPVHSCRPSIRW